MRLAILLSLLLLGAGCLGMAENEGEGDEAGATDASAQNEAVEREPVEEERVFEASIDQPTLADGRLGIEWPASSPANLMRLELVLAWTQETNRLGLEVETPDGEVEEAGPAMLPGSTRVALTLEEAPTGSYVFHPTGDGPVAPDQLTLTATFTYAVLTASTPTTEAASGEASSSESDVETERTDDGRWIARITYAATGEAGDTVRANLDTVNGHIGLQGGADELGAQVTAYARADTEDQAEQRVRELTVTLHASGGQLTADIQAPERASGGEDWNDRGAHIQARVPSGTTTTGMADTTNGAIVFEDLTVAGFSADTTNGAIEGDLTGQGELTFDTTNGRVAVELDPTGNVDLTADTTNGGIALGLQEGDQIAYRLDADTTNGQIDEAMDEADLDYHNERGTEATLATENGDTRPIQVTGNVDTTNGGIFFQGR